MAVTYLNKYEYMSELLQENNGYLFTTQVEKNWYFKNIPGKICSKEYVEAYTVW